MLTTSATEEKRAERLKLLNSISKDLLAVRGNKCFICPLFSNFEVKDFMTLKGIGKGVNPNYNLTMIALPHLKGLIDFKDGLAAVTTAEAFRQKVCWRNKDFST